MKNSVKERLLEVLNNYQGNYIPQSHLYRVVRASKSRISEILKELEREGLVTRTIIGRSKLVYVHPGISERKVPLEWKRLRLGIVYSSEYLFLGYFMKELSKHGINTDVVVTRDGLTTTKALAEGILDLALSPFVGQLYLYPIYKTYRIILGGLHGGFRVLYKPGENVIYSSMISTMDYIRHYTLERGLIDAEETRYFDDPSKLNGLIKNGGYVVTWHPIYLFLREAGFKETLTPEDVEVDFCCTLAVSNTVNNRYYQLVKKAYKEAIENYEKNPERYLNYYSVITGIDTDILKIAVKEYKPSRAMSKGVVERVVKAYSPRVPVVNIYVEPCDE